MTRPDLDRRIGARSFARLLGDWRPPDGRGLASALAERVRLLVLDGRLPLQTRVPAERELAGALDVSRTTVAAAYDTLRVAEVLHSRRGAGSWTRVPSGAPGGPSSPWAPAGDGARFDLALAAMPAPETVRTALAEAAVDLDALLATHGYELAGLPVLRRAIAERYTARGLPTNPDQVLVTSGAQGAISLIVTALTAPGDRVLVEHPTYPNALTTLLQHGVRPVPAPLVPGGWDLDLMTTAVHDAAPRLCYLIPEFQNPTGSVLEPACRERLVALARNTGTPIVADETLVELWLDEPGPPPVAAHGAADSSLVLTVGSAGKTFWGGLRIGWIRTSASMVRRLAAVRAGIDMGNPVLEQLVVARLLADVEATAAGRRTELVGRRDHLVAELGRRFPAWRVRTPAGGLSSWIDLGEPVSSRLVSAARRHDVLLAAGPRFGVDGGFEHYLRLPYTFDPVRMDQALDRIATAWAELDRTATAGDPDHVSVA